MKKIFLCVLFGAVILTGCGSKEKAEDSKTDSSVTLVESTEEVAKVDDKFSGETEKGEGTFDISSKSGSTADGQDVVVYYDETTFPTAVSFMSRDMDGSMLSYIYADGQLLDKKQIGTTQSEIQLQDVKSAITEGDHKIQVVQYEDDNEGGTIVTFKEQPYTIKLK